MENEENKTKDKLLEEVKKLRKEVTDDNKKKQQNSTYNSMIVIGIIWLLLHSFCGNVLEYLVSMKTAFCYHYLISFNLL